MAKKSKIRSTAEPKRRDAGVSPGREYPDLHEHLEALERAGLLITVDRPINKDTEMHPLVRWQFRGGIEEPDRKAFLFTQVTDGKRRKYDRDLPHRHGLRPGRNQRDLEPRDGEADRAANRRGRTLP